MTNINLINFTNLYNQFQEHILSFKLANLPLIMNYHKLILHLIIL